SCHDSLLPQGWSPGTGGGRSSQSAGTARQGFMCSRQNRGSGEAKGPFSEYFFPGGAPPPKGEERHAAPPRAPPPARAPPTPRHPPERRHPATRADPARTKATPAVPEAVEAEQLRRVGAETPLPIHVEDAEGSILLGARGRAGTPGVQQGGCRGFELADLQ